MKHILFLFILISLADAISAQYIYTIRADSVKLTNCDSSELIIENHTQNVPGFLFNTGHGRTIFKRAAQRLTDSSYLIGADTLILNTNSWIQGGNSFGTTGILGTKDNNSLDLYTDNIQRVHLTNNGNLSVGTSADNGRKLQVNGTLSVSDTSFLSGFTLGSNAYTSIIKGSGGNGVMIGSDGASNNIPSAFTNNASGSVIIHAPTSAIGGIAGSISNSVYIGGNSSSSSGTFTNSLVIAKDMGFDQVYNGALIRSNILALGGSQGILRDDNTNGSSYLLANFKGNIYFGYDVNNWMYPQDAPTNYIQIGGSGHNLLALFGGFHSLAPRQSTLAGPSQRPETTDFGFPAGSYFRLAAGRGTGTGTGTDLRLAVAPPGISSSSLNTYVDAITIAAANAFVGIGTSSPAAQLHTTGTVRFAGLTSDATKTRVLVSDASGNLYYRDASTLAGNGTLNSSLAVNGTISAQRLKLSQAGWPDYVFDSNYRLPSLKELEQYIQKNSHLPGIPSAAEVESKGIDVGDHQAALLKKIEELTLYVIGQEKTLRMQSDDLQKQKAEINVLKERDQILERQDKELEALRQEMIELRKLIKNKSNK